MEITQAIESLLTRAYENDYFSGACLVKKLGETVYQGAFGFAHKGFRVPNTVSTRFDTASITKLFTAVAVLQLVDAGKVQLDDSVIEILGLQGTAISSQVTLYQLLTHTSGIGDDADEEAGESYEDLWRTKPNYSIRETIDFLPQFILKPPNFEPGMSCRYNNVAYILLGLVIEKVTRSRYRDVVTEGIFRQAGMTDTEFCNMDGVFADVAEGYTPVVGLDGKLIKWRKNIYSFPPIGSPDGGAYSTVNDLARFVEALKQGELLSADLTNDILTPQVKWGREANYEKWMGYGFEFIVKPTETARPIICMEKDGINAGVICRLHHYPSTNALIVILANQECRLQKIVNDIQSLL